MTPADFLDRLRKQGISVSLRPDGKLWLEPKTALTPDLVAEARAHKDAIGALLAGQSGEGKTETPASEYEVLGPSSAGERCTLCGGGRDVERIRYGGEVRLWHRGCADPYVAAMRAPPVPADAADVTADAAPSPPDLDARAAELLAAAETSPVVKIVDRERALLFYRGRAARELTPERFDPAIHRMRPPDWSDPRDEPQAGDRCSTCRGSQWWTEGGLPKRGWRCCRCRPPHTAIGVHRVQT